MKRLIYILLLITVTLNAPRAFASPSLCAFTGNISQIYGGVSSTGSGVRVNYKGIITQNSSGSIVPGGSQCSVTTDVNGNLPTTGACTSFLQGVLMNVTIGHGQPTQIQVPVAASADLSALYVANNSPPSLVNTVTVAAGGDYILTVSASPSPGALGTVVLQPGDVVAMHAFGATPTSWPLDFSAAQITLGNATAFPFPTGSGQITVTDTTSTGCTAIYVCGGGACVMAGASRSGIGFANIPSNATPSPNFSGIISNGLVYELINNTGGTITYGVALERTRPAL